MKFWVEYVSVEDLIKVFICHFIDSKENARKLFF